MENLGLDASFHFLEASQHESVGLKQYNCSQTGLKSCIESGTKTSSISKKFFHALLVAIEPLDIDLVILPYVTRSRSLYYLVN